MLAVILSRPWHVQVALVYLEGFLVTMAREWPSIDKLRLDKFMMLVRHFIHTGFSMLQEHKWCALLCGHALLPGQPCTVLVSAEKKQQGKSPDNRIG